MRQVIPNFSIGKTASPSRQLDKTSWHTSDGSRLYGFIPLALTHKHDKIILCNNIGIAYNTIMERIVIDTNVFYSALRSKKGASHLLLTLVGAERFKIALSVPLVVEYEDVAKRSLAALGLDTQDVDAIIDYLCSAAHLQEVHYLWRPVLKNVLDDHVLELAVAAESKVIVTYNAKSFAEASRFGIEVLTPPEYLQRIGEISWA